MKINAVVEGVVAAPLISTDKFIAAERAIAQLISTRPLLESSSNLRQYGVGVDPVSPLLLDTRRVGMGPFGGALAMTLFFGVATS